MKFLAEKIIKSEHQIFNIYLLLFAGLIIRLFLAILPGFKIDTDAWFAWSLRLLEVGLPSFYTPDVWTNYTPGFLYILYIWGIFREIFPLSAEGFYYLLKIPAILADLTLGYLIYQKLRESSSKQIATAACAFFIFNPVSLFNSAVWGQIDSFLTLFIYISIDRFSEKKYILAAFFWGLAFLIKPQAISVLPVFGIYFAQKLIKNYRSLNSPLLMLGTSIVTILVFSLPFFLTDPIFGIFKLVAQMAQDYPGNSMFAYNLWGIFGFWIPDNTILGIISYRNWSLIFLIAFWAILFMLHLKRRLLILALTILALMSFYFLPTRVHERYLFPAFPFLILFALQIKSRLLILLTFILSFIHFINLYYVYVYYNELYLNSSRVLYIPGLYEIIQTFNSTLSLLSTVIFALIAFTVVSKRHKIEHQ